MRVAAGSYSRCQAGRCAHANTATRELSAGGWATASIATAVIVGCTDSTALNYNENTTQEDNSTCYYTLPSVIINEVHYNPCTAQGDDFDFEFVELLNIDDVAADLSGYQFYNESGGLAQLSFVFPEGTTLTAGEFMVNAEMLG